MTPKAIGAASTNATPTPIWPLFLYLTLVIVVWGAYWYLVTNNIDSSADVGNARGIFGDMFGAVNALFSGFAFTGIVYAIYLQRKELSLQWQELREQTRLFEEQNATLQRAVRQEFVQKFFNEYATPDFFNARKILEHPSTPYTDLASFEGAFENNLEEATRARRRVKHLLAWLGNLLESKVLIEEEVFFVDLPYELYKKENGEDGALLKVEKDLLQRTRTEGRYNARIDSVWFAEKCSELYRNYLRSQLNKPEPKHKVTRGTA